MKLRFTIFSICWVLVCSISFAQTKPRIEDQWRIFQPANEEFGVVTPVELTTFGSHEPKSSRRYSGYFNGVYFFVFSDQDSDRHNFSKIAGYLKNWGQTLEVSNEPTVPSSLSFRDQHGYWQNIVVIRTDTRIYLAQTIGRSKLDPMARRFIESFVVGPIDASKVDLSALDSEMTEPEKSKATDSQSTKSSRADTTSGSTSGTPASSFKIATPDLTPKNYTLTPIKLLTKPVPTYPEMARFYGISGTIILSMTFLASGELGAIGLVETLPLGLTERTIEAAKLIRFEPSTRDGTPITVTKRVEYSFRIY